MSCNRCYDIHQAQKEGKTQESCKCNCHNITSTGGTTTIPFIWTNSTSATTATVPTSTCTFDTSGNAPHECRKCTYSSVNERCINCNCKSNESCAMCKNKKSEEYHCKTYGCENKTNNQDGICNPCKFKQERGDF